MKKNFGTKGPFESQDRKNRGIGKTQDSDRNTIVKQRIAKHRNGRLIRPQKKHRNQMREIDSEEMFQEDRPIANFPPKCA